MPTFAPVVDGVVLPKEPLEAIREGASSSVPVIIGTNSDEMEVMRLLDKSIYDFGDDEVERRAVHLFGDLSGQALALYRGPARGTTENVWTAVDTDRTFLVPAIVLADAHVAGGRGDLAVPVHLDDHRLRGTNGSGPHARDPLRLQ